MPTAKVKTPRCTVCAHPERHRIEMLRLAGTSAYKIAEAFSDVGHMSVYRHMEKCVDAQTKAAMVADVPMAELAERAVREGGSLLDYFTIVRSTVMSALQRASAVNDYTGTAALAKRATEINREIGRLTGELLSNTPVGHFTQNNIFMGGPIMAQLETMLVERLAPFPEAMRAVLEGLQALDSAKSPAIDALPLEASCAA